MDREEIIAAVKAYTNIDTDEVTTICQNHIDLIQDNEICSNVYNHDFSFLTDYAEINTSATYSDGTVSITQDSATVTGTGTSWTTEYEGWYIKFNDDSEYYEIVDIDVSAQRLTLSSTYIGETDTDATYTMYKVFYALPSDFKKMKWAKQIISPSKILPLPEMTMVDYYTNEFDYSGEIQGYVLSGLNSSGIPQIRFYPIQTTRKRIYICYVKKLPSINTIGAESLIPSQWHMLFVYKLNEIVFDANDMPIKAQKEAQKFDKLLQTFIKEDKQINKDRIDTMQSRFLAGSITLPRFDPIHYSNKY